MGQSFRVIWISDFAPQGSGYLNISVPLCTGLTNLGHDVKVIGLSYDGRQNDYPFNCVPCANFSDAMAMITNLKAMFNPDFCVVALDIPLQENFLKVLAEKKIPHIAITPLESDPLCFSWANLLSMITKVFVISEFGAKECQTKGVESAEHIEVGVDTDLWRRRTPAEKDAFRDGLGIPKDAFVILTVADNQERKNLGKSLEIVSKFKKVTGCKLRYLLVTREKSPVGWKLRDLAMEYDIASELMIFERGMSQDALWGIYATSDAFLLTSKGEGLCVLPDTSVWTGDGLVSIQNVSLGDWVYSRDGKLHLVKDTMARQVDEQINNIEIGFGLDNIRVTSSHPVLASKNYGRTGINGNLRKISSLAYYDADSLEKGDFIFYPKPREYDKRKVCISDYVKNTTVSDDGKVYSIGRNQFGATFIHPQKEHAQKDEINIDNDFCSLLGWFVAEGCNTGEGLSFSLNQNEIKPREHIRRIVRQKFSLELHDSFMERNRYDGRVYHTLLGRFFSSMCGKDAREKHLPNWALYLNEEKSWSLLEALFSGDGNYDEKSATLRYSTTSKKLSRQIQFILFRMGIVSSVRDNEKKPEYTVSVHRPEIFKIPFLIDKYIPEVPKTQRQFIELDDGWLIPIRSNKKEHYSGLVYNLEVEETHDFLLAGGVVHNCMPVLEAMSVGIPVVASGVGALTEHLSYERGFILSNEYDGYRDPWGNEKRFFASTKDGVVALDKVWKKIDVERFVERARAYVEGRKWDKPTRQLVSAMEIIHGQKP